MRIQGIGLYRHLQRDGCRVWMITEFYCFITAGFWIIITRLWFMRKTCHIAQPWDTGRGGSGAISCCDYLFSCLCQVFSSQCYLKSSVNRRNEEKFYIFPEKKKKSYIFLALVWQELVFHRQEETSYMLLSTSREFGVPNHIQAPSQASEILIPFICLFQYNCFSADVKPLLYYFFL